MHQKPSPQTPEVISGGSHFQKACAISQNESFLHPHCQLPLSNPRPFYPLFSSQNFEIHKHLKCFQKRSDAVNLYTTVFAVLAGIRLGQGSVQKQAMADGVGFEPTLPFGKHAFQACAIDHSATRPRNARNLNAIHEKRQSGCVIYGNNPRTFLASATFLMPMASAASRW